MTIKKRILIFIRNLFHPGYERKKTLILRELSRGPMYGIEIVRATNVGSIQSLYPTLLRMEEDELIESYEEKMGRKDRSGKPRRYYKLKQ